MSSPSTVRRFGTAKTYGRAKENPASRSFDEMLSGKPAPIKASPSYTKWGKTNFVAIRDEKKSKLATSSEPEQVTQPTVSDDPFSFDTEDRRKASPGKRVVVTAEAPSQRSSTRLPASRIMTQGKNASGNSSSQESSESSLPSAIARPGRTYTRAQEGRVSTGGTSQQLIMDQFMAVGKTVKTDSGIEVVYSIQPHAPGITEQVPTRKFAAPISTIEKSPPKIKADHSPSSSFEDSQRSSRSVFDDDEDEDDPFPVLFKRTPLKTYTGEIITPISDLPDDPPSKKRKKGATGLPRGRKPSRYTDPSLIEEYRKRYEETHGKREPTAGMFNSTVISAKELKGTQGTTLVVVCKPKVEVSDKKDDVQTKYFKNVRREIKQADKNLEAADSESQEDAITVSSTDVEPASISPKAPSLKKSPASSQDSGSTVSTPTRMLRVRFADESSSPANSSTKSSPEKRPARGAAAHRNKPVAISSSSESVKSSNSAATDKTETTVTRRTRSSGKQYRIFKSRGPPQPEPAKEEVPAFADSNSPPMPQLTRETPELSNEESDGQHPPNIFEETEQSEDIETTEEMDTEVSDSQGSQLNNSNMLSKTSESVEDLSSSQERPTDSQDTPSPAASDDSQELSQEIMSSAESSQKEESASSAPRRFFKSKKSTSASSLQRKVFEKSPSKASYNARSWHRDEESKEKETSDQPPSKQAKKVIPFSDEDEPPTKAAKEPKLTRAVHWSRDKSQEAYTSVRVHKDHKELYTVVHNVKMAHEVQESGETQDFMADVDYLLENLKDSKPFSIRALSTIQLAGKCIMPAFRMHLRAHGTVTKVFSLLHDACLDSSLALSTASMMFMLSRDRLNMDLDKESLHLMLKLNEVDIPRNNGDDSGNAEQTIGVEESSELQKCRTKVKELLDKLQRETNAKQIDLDFVSTGNLAMESLLSLTSRRAGEWFKEELRQLGGLDHFVETINRCMSTMKGDLATNLDAFTPTLKKLDRCLRVLENITFMNSDNQNYLINYNNGLLISTTGSMLKQCADCLPTMPLQEVENEEDLKAQAGWIVFDCLLAILRVMLNLTHDSELGCTRFGDEATLMPVVLQCVVSTKWCVPPDQRFDLLVLSLGLLVNLMEHCRTNRQQLMETTLSAQMNEGSQPKEMSAVEALVQVFLQRETAARQMEEAPESPTKGGSESPNKSGEWRESDSGIEWIAKSAEKVKKASEKPSEGEKEKDSKNGETQDGENADKSIDGASILEDEETFTKALHKAGKHMENSIVASYVGLLLGCLIQDNKEYVEVVRKHLPDGSFDPMVKVLKKFLGFMSLTTAIGTTDANSLQRVIDTLEGC